MSVIRFVVRIVLVAIVCASATMWLGWVSIPCIGFIYGMSDRRARARGSIAAIGGALGWIALLGAEAARGADMRAVAERMGAVMQIPGVAFAIATLAFAALLCGTAAALGVAAGDMATRQLHTGPT